MSSYFVQCCCADSYESTFHRTNITQFALNLHKGNEELRQALKGPKHERFIGVIYLPKSERYRCVTFNAPAGKSTWCIGGTVLAVRPLTSAFDLFECFEICQERLLSHRYGQQH